MPTYPDGFQVLRHVDDGELPDLDPSTIRACGVGGSCVAVPSIYRVEFDIVAKLERIEFSNRATLEAIETIRSGIAARQQPVPPMRPLQKIRR